MRDGMESTLEKMFSIQCYINSMYLAIFNNELDKCEKKKVLIELRYAKSYLKKLKEKNNQMGGLHYV